MSSNHSTWIIYAIWLKFSILKILSRKKKVHIHYYDFDLSNMDEVFQTIYILKRKL